VVTFAQCQLVRWAVGDFTVDLQLNEFRRITQEELIDLMSDLDLPKSKAELLGSRLQQWNLLKENVRISVFRKSTKI